jgi:hypothetical protein
MPLDWNKGIELLSGAVEDLADSSRTEIELLRCKKDRYVRFKELEEPAFRQHTGPERMSLRDPCFQSLVHAIRSIHEKIDALQRIVKPQRQDGV